MLLANGGLGGLGGYFVGRMYRNEHELRRQYRERANVGGFFGSLLSSAEFDFFLSLLCFLLVLNVLQKHLLVAPVTSCAVLFMIFLRFEKDVLGERNTFLTTENYNKYSFHPQHIIDGQWYRLVTGPLLHKGRKLHLYLNMTALVQLCQLEAKSTMSVLLYIVFFAGMIIASGILYICFIKKYKKRGEQGLNSYGSAAGFTGVLFALKCYHNTTKIDTYGDLSFPLAGDLFSYSIPVAVPSFAEHFVELFLVTVLFGSDIPFLAMVAGIVSGYLAVGIEATLVALGVMNPWTRSTGTIHDYVNYELNPTKEGFQSYARAFKKMFGFVVGFCKENAIVVALFVVIVTYVYKSTCERERELQRRLVEMERRQQQVLRGEQDTASRPDTVPSEVPLEVVSAQESWTLAGDLDSKTSDEMESKAQSSCDSLYDDYSTSNYDLPSAFIAALHVLTTVTEKQDQGSIVEALQTLQVVITNAVTKGQTKDKDAAKYRRIRVTNTKVQKCNIDGAFGLLMAVGFAVREDFDGEKWLVYPKRENPEWMPAALEAIKVQLGELSPAEKAKSQDFDNSGLSRDELKRRRLAAALKRQAKSKTKKKRPRESQFTPGMGGGNSNAVYFHGGT